MHTRQLEIVILAAGLGRRFEKCGGVGHKALAPVWDSRGTLQLLVERLTSCFDDKNPLVTIVTGRYAADIATAVADKNLRIIHNPDHASETLLHSIALACAEPQPKATLVLFADTLYSKQTLETLIKAGLSHAAISETAANIYALVAVSPIQTTNEKSFKNETHVDISLNGDVLGFNHPNSEWQMAHAVIWPRKFIPNLLDAVKNKYADRQWQVLQLIAEKNSQVAAKAIRLPIDASSDIDTFDDLLDLQHQHRIQPCHFEYFLTHISKERTLNSQSDALSGVIYQKQCESVDAAKHEFLMMQILYAHQPDLLVKPITLSGRCLKMGYAAGIRLYDLLRHLTGHPRETAIRSILLARCIERLRDMQDCWRRLNIDQLINFGSASTMQDLMMRDPETIATVPYPFDSKVIDLLETLAALLKIPFNPDVKYELANMGLAWNTNCVIPFRDATPKNIIVAIESLAPLINKQERARRLSKILEKDDAFWREVPLIDIDFTSTNELTTPEDDVISLLAHGMTFRPDHANFASQPLLTTFDPSPQRVDLTWFVRYLRFGGRKLLYKLLNPKGFAIRFRYDEPSFYFEQLPQRLSDNFKVVYPHTFALLLKLRDRSERYRGYFPNQDVNDFFLTSLDLKSPAALKYYWQESPLERIAQHD